MALEATKKSCTIIFAISKVTTLSPIDITLKFLPHSAAVYSLYATEQGIPHFAADIPIPIPDPQISMPLSSGFMISDIFFAN